jgi:hypothetical protein
LLAAGRVELPDHPRLLNQFSSLERRVRAGGRDLITHPPGGHDDLANACAGAVYYANRTGRHSFFIWSPFDDRLSEAALNFMSGKRS